MKRGVSNCCETGFRNLIRYKCKQTAISEAIDLVGSLLVNNPSKRLTAKEALYHAFFSKFPKPDRIETVGLNLGHITEELGVRLNGRLILFDRNGCPKYLIDEVLEK